MAYRQPENRWLLNFEQSTGAAISEARLTSYGLASLMLNIIDNCVSTLSRISDYPESPPSAGRLDAYRLAGYPLGKSIKGYKKWVKRNEA